MKSILKQIADQNRQMEKAEADAINAEIANPATTSDRRSFLKKAALGGIALGGMMNLSIEDTIAQTTSKVQRSSAPSDLKITDMRTAKTAVMGGTAIVRIDTNQGIYGLGEVRDAADSRYALMLKSRILGENPCNVEKIFKIVKQFGYHGRQGGGVCAVEMAMWDLCGKAYGVPAWQLLGGRYRDKIRLYADTPGGDNPEQQRERIKYRTVDQGYTWLKMDLGIRSIMHIPGTLVNQAYWTENDRLMREIKDYYMTSGRTLHPFTQIQITDKGLEEMGKIVAEARDLVGWEIPIFTDHFGHFDYNNGIRLGRVLEKYRLACMEDIVAWFYTEQWKKLSDALETPMMTGEDIYLLAGFKPLIDMQAVDIVHPDLATSGGLLETKKIGDYAEENGIAMAMHQAGTPVSFMANVHCAAATQNFLALEHHSVDVEWWESLVKMTGKKPLIEKGFAPVPLDSPGLGIELNEEVVKQHLRPDEPGYFLPTPEWDQRRAADHLWS
ncbi:MAG: mandelate racemase/muconate lactonizing enzyme family protein [Bacteroidales bacterium]|jgi:L-alanine-DL-glutamate epimerase-like enolase superfamily enzyme|nr:mandelate racemase/muconate lactonizing enzyme family protein [Bacteroidales bacterium]